jgi:hypothetical protein
MPDGPLKTAFDLLDADGVVSRELITYRVRDDIFVKETVQRKYSNNTYIDSTKTEPLTNIRRKRCGH